LFKFQIGKVYNIERQRTAFHKRERKVELNQE